MREPHAPRYVWKRGKFPKARWPKHASDYLRRCLRAEALGLRGLYDVPVYLVGSALFDCNERPADWDLRIILPDPEFERRYGSVERWQFESSEPQWTDVRWRWQADCVKRSKQASLNCGVLVDVQIYPASYDGRFTGRSRRQLA